MDSSKDIKDRYASEAETYRKDALLINFDAERLFNEFKIILKKLFNNNISELNILDIGAGNGMLTEIVLEVFPNANITMLDFSPEMLDSAKAIFEKNNISFDKIRFSIKDFITDDFPNEKYDLIVSSYALHHIRRKDELETVYKKIASALKIGGGYLYLLR